MICERCQNDNHRMCEGGACACPYRTTDHEDRQRNQINYEVADRIYGKLMHTNSAAAVNAAISCGPENIKHLIGESIELFKMEARSYAPPPGVNMDRVLEELHGLCAVENNLKIGGNNAQKDALRKSSQALRDGLKKNGNLTINEILTGTGVF